MRYSKPIKSIRLWALERNIMLWGMMLIMFFFAACRDNSPSEGIRKQSIVEAVYANGSLVPARQVQIQAFRSAELKFLAPEGSEMGQGDVMAILSDGANKERLESARQAYQLAILNASEEGPLLKEMASKYRVLAEKYQFDSVNAERFTRLFKANSSNKIDFEKALLALEASRGERRAFELNLSQTRERLRLEKQQAMVQLQSQAFEQQQLVIKAPFAGKIYKLFKKEGENCVAGSPLLLFGSSKQMVCELKIDEQDLAKVKEGQKVWVKADAISEKPFQARVVKVYPWVEGRDQSVRVDAEPEGILPATLGVSLEANIEIRTKKNAWVVSKDLLVDQDYIWIERQDQRIKQKVRKGIESADKVEILGGLLETDRLYRPE